MKSLLIGVLCHSCHVISKHTSWKFRSFPVFAGLRSSEYAGGRLGGEERSDPLSAARQTEPQPHPDHGPRWVLTPPQSGHSSVQTNPLCFQVWSTWNTCICLRWTWTAPAWVGQASPTCSLWPTSAASGPATPAPSRRTRSPTRTEERSAAARAAPPTIMHGKFNR